MELGGSSPLSLLYCLNGSSTPHNNAASIAPTPARPSTLCPTAITFAAPVKTAGFVEVAAADEDAFADVELATAAAVEEDAFDVDVTTAAADVAGDDAFVVDTTTDDVEELVALLLELVALLLELELLLVEVGLVEVLRTVDSVVELAFEVVEGVGVVEV